MKEIIEFVWASFVFVFIISSLCLLTANFGFAKSRKVNTKSGVGGMWVRRCDDSADLCCIIKQQLAKRQKGTHI